jgi:uncharacterized protein RhaS with RHS repeats
MSGEVVNLREAARLTGWSVKTLRRRCTKGELAGAQRVQVGQGAPEWVIPVASLPHRQGTDRVGASASVDRVGNLTAQQGDGVAALAAVISDLTARLAEAQEQVARLTGEAAEARGQVLQLQAGAGGSLLSTLRKRLGG